MPIERWSDNVVVVHLADDPQFTDDLETLEKSLNSGTGATAAPNHKKSSHAVLDFAAVHFINSSNIARMLKIRQRMNGKDGKLVLCGISTQVWGTFLVTGLDKVFTFSD